MEEGKEEEGKEVEKKEGKKGGARGVKMEVEEPEEVGKEEVAREGDSTRRLRRGT